MFGLYIIVYSLSKLSLFGSFAMWLVKVKWRVSRESISVTESHTSFNFILAASAFG